MSIEWEAGWTPKPVQTLCENRKISCHYREPPNHDSTTASP